MLTNAIERKFTSLLFRASKLQQLIDNERRGTAGSGLRLMRLNSLRLRVMNSLYRVIALAMQKRQVPALAYAGASRKRVR